MGIETNSFGYKPGGTDITKEDLVSRALVSEEDIKKGNTKTSKQVREETKTW